MRFLARAAALVLVLFAIPASATFHLWTMNELYSNADGTVQFLEITALTGDQQFMAGHSLQATGGGSTRSFTFPGNLPGNSAGKRMLVATQGFAALGIVTPDYVVPNGFFTPGGGTINFAESSDLWTYGALPGGTTSLNRDGSTAAASPQNFAGATGTLSGGSTPTPVATFNVQALWWRSPARSELGWGINIVHQGNTLFATWFTYDADGTDLWLFMDNMTLTANNTYSGNVFRANGSPFGLVPYDSSRFAPTQVGTATIAFSDANNGSITYTVNGVQQTKPITKFIYSNPVPTCDTAGANPYGTVSYQDLWWRSPARSENGAGINIIHQGEILFVTWFTYDTDGTGMWLFMDNAAKTATRTYAGAVLQARGSPVNLIPFDASRFSASNVGSGTITFSDDNTGTFAYTVKGVTQTVPIIRFVYSSTLTSCKFETMDNDDGMDPPDPYS